MIYEPQCVYHEYKTGDEIAEIYQTLTKLGIKIKATQPHMILTVGRPCRWNVFFYIDKPISQPLPRPQLDIDTKTVSPTKKLEVKL